MLKSKSLSQRLSVASLISLVGVLFLSSRSFLLTNESNYVRKLSEALQNGGCFVLPAEEVGPDVKPVFAGTSFIVESNTMSGHLVSLENFYRF